MKELFAKLLAQLIPVLVELAKAEIDKKKAR